MKTIKVGGMSCQHCVKSVTQAVQGVMGVKDVKVDLDRGEASYEEASPVDAETVKDAIRKIGFTVED